MTQATSVMEASGTISYMSASSTEMTQLGTCYLEEASLDSLGVPVSWRLWGR